MAKRKANHGEPHKVTSKSYEASTKSKSCGANTKSGQSGQCDEQSNDMVKANRIGNVLNERMNKVQKELYGKGLDELIKDSAFVDFKDADRYGHVHPKYRYPSNGHIIDEESEEYKKALDEWTYDHSTKYKIPIDEHSRGPYKQVMSEKQCGAFIALKNIGIGTARACHMVGVTVGVFETSCKLDPGFADLAKTADLGKEDDCDFVMYSKAVANGGSYAYASRYLAQARRWQVMKRELTMRHKEMTRRLDMARATVNVNVASSNVDVNNHRLDSLSTYEIGQYKLLFDRICRNEELTDKESVEYVRLQQKVLSNQGPVDVDFHGIDDVKDFIKHPTKGPQEVMVEEIISDMKDDPVTDDEYQKLYEETKALGLEGVDDPPTDQIPSPPLDTSIHSVDSGPDPMSAFNSNGNGNGNGHHNGNGNGAH